MQVSVNLYSSKKGEINKFLSSFYNTNFNIANDLSWEKNMPILLNWQKLSVLSLIIAKTFILICGFV